MLHVKFRAQNWEAGLLRQSLMRLIISLTRPNGRLRSHPPSHCQNETKLLDTEAQRYRRDYICASLHVCFALYLLLGASSICIISVLIPLRIRRWALQMCVFLLHCPSLHVLMPPHSPSRSTTACVWQLKHELLGSHLFNAQRMMW